MVTNLLKFLHQRCESYCVSNYCSGWREDVVNRCLEFVTWLAESELDLWIMTLSTDCFGKTSLNISWLQDLSAHRRIPSYWLSQNSTAKLKVTNCSFSYFAAKSWNSLQSSNIRHAKTLDSFKSKLKSYRFTVHLIFTATAILPFPQNNLPELLLLGERARACMCVLYCYYIIVYYFKQMH